MMEILLSLFLGEAFNCIAEHGARRVWESITVLYVTHTEQ